MIDWHIGCSGFYYRDWKGPFYPVDLPQRKWFEFYCQHFRTIELNVTFYRFPKLSFLQRWYQKSPPDFRFAVKAPRAITHFKKFNDAGDMITSFYDTINNGLQEKLGPVLFQLPPGFSYDDQRLGRIINSLNHSFNNVTEFRHPSWWRHNVYAELAKNNISFCGQSHPKLADDVIVNTENAYYRFHGVPDLYRSRYNIGVLKGVIDNIKQSEKVKQAWCYFNNDYDATGAFNAEEMVMLAM